MFIKVHDRKYDWQEFTLILPTVSVGNVGQLAVDLVISTLSMDRVGYIFHPSLLPVVGNNPYADGDPTKYQITTCCEVFENQQAKIVVIQQRAPIIKGRKREYAKWLSDWISQEQFQQVVVLTSSFSQERLDHQISGSLFRILQSQQMREKAGTFFRDTMQWQEVEPRHFIPQPAHSQAGTEEDMEQDKLLYIPGSGIAKLLYENCKEQSVLVLLMYVSEGDNAQDALAMTDQLNQWLNLISHKNQPAHGTEHTGNLNKENVEWKIPHSWRLVFGSRFDQRLY